MKRGKRILLIDDEKSICITLQYRLEKEGFDCDVVMSGKKGIEKLDNNTCLFDLVITDLYMPPLSAIDIIKKVKEINPPIPVIVITGFHNSPLLDEVIKLSPCQQVFKPFPMDEFMEKVHKCFKETN